MSPSVYAIHIAFAIVHMCEAVVRPKRRVPPTRLLDVVGINVHSAIATDLARIHFAHAGGQNGGTVACEKLDVHFIGWIVDEPRRIF
jgi:hypothetical protein